MSEAPALPSSKDTRVSQHASQSYFAEFDDTSSLSTLSSPSAFTPSPPHQPSTPTMPLSPPKKRRIEGLFHPDSNFSTPSTLSTPSPMVSYRTSPERDPMTESSVHEMGEDEKPSPRDNAPSIQEDSHSLEMELFGAIAKPKKDLKVNAGKKDVTSTMQDSSRNSKNNSIRTSSSSSNKPRGLAVKRLLGKKSVTSSSKKSRELVVIKVDKDNKATASIRHVPYTTNTSDSLSSSPSGGSKSARTTTKTAQEQTSQANINSEVNGDAMPNSVTISTGGARRSSILHSDQIVASAISRYKNHFHMLVEDSDSTVASNPSSTGADMMHVSLEYPGKDSREKFTLMKPFLSRSKTETDDKDEYNPIEDLVQTVKTIIEHFFTPEKQKELFGTQSEGLFRNLTKYKNRKDGAQFLKAVEDFNRILTKHKDSGEIARYVQEYGHRLPYELVVHILQQVYSRTVAARASKLNQYEAFSNNVYGEILPILTKEFIQKGKLNEKKVFVDLGCGIGNVVLQVALQTGAESYGVEIMDTPAKFAKKQAKEFEARTRAYGLHHGKVTMIHGDFLDTPELAGILARADVVLVNNYAFNSALNQSLLQLFLDLKEGCKIISLKTFVSLDHKINVRNAGSVESILRVKKYPYYTNAVSWTHNGGEYFIATVDRSAVQAFWENAMANGGVADGGGRRSSRRS
ncbi:Nucleosomal histone H3-Lys79 methylase [Podila epigama]|nr:Nucleosomal histone H3-Lys79 methylase [Podila epigama]